MPEQFPQVSIQDCQAFAKRWTTPNGASIFLDQYSLKFANDWANVVLRNYVELQRREAAEAKKPSVVLSE